MGRKKAGITLQGPTLDKSRGRWRYFIKYEDGSREGYRAPKGATKEEAIAEAHGALDAALGLHNARTVAEGIEAYADHLERTKSIASRDWLINSTKAINRLSGHILIKSLRRAHVEKYVAETADLAMATRRSYWRAFRRMVDYWNRRGWISTDPIGAYLNTIERRGEDLPWKTNAGAAQIGRGKAQLRSESEARRYLKAALALDTSERRVAAALPLLTGIASGELRHLTAGRIDVAGGAIWIDDYDVDGWTVKTATRRRSLPIPAVLECDLRLLTAGRDPDDLVFTQRGEPNRPRGRTWLRDLVRSVCKAAAVRVVNPHGLRGSFASLLVERERRALADVGLVLGHADEGRTAARNYIGAAERRPELRILDGLK